MVYTGKVPNSQPATQHEPHKQTKSDLRRDLANAQQLFYICIFPAVSRSLTFTPCLPLHRFFCRILSHKFAQYTQFRDVMFYLQMFSFSHSINRHYMASIKGMLSIQDYW